MDELDRQIDQYYASWLSVTALYDRWAAARGVTSNMVFVLLALSRSEGGCTQRSICQTMLLSKQTVSSIVETLTRKGLVQACPNPSDRRQKILHFTPQGHTFSAPLLAELRAMERRVLARLPPASRLSLIQSNEAFEQALADEVD